ncbi:MAG: 3-deoxy-manno-octulosonate cytidylyltransferase [Bacteroidota bacterium]
MILAVIPARYGSTRFPGKPLVEIQGKTMIRRVMEQCQKAERVDRVIVATDDVRIAEEVRQHGGIAEMTADHHKSGTERVAEVAERHGEFSYVLNIQGDEPFLDPKQIDQLCEVLVEGAQEIATLVTPIHDADTLFNPNSVKVVQSLSGYAMYFSRSPIPFCRDTADKDVWPKQVQYLKHIGIYGFSREVLMKIPAMRPSPLETAESLEQLRWLANGYKIRLAKTQLEAQSVDSPEDLDHFSQ